MLEANHRGFPLHTPYMPVGMFSAQQLNQVYLVSQRGYTRLSYWISVRPDPDDMPKISMYMGRPPAQPHTCQKIFSICNVV